jgi:hypothetical protein
MWDGYVHAGNAMHCTMPSLAPPLSSLANLAPLLPVALLDLPMLALVGEEHHNAGNVTCPRHPVSPEHAWPRRCVQGRACPDAVPCHCPSPRLEPRVCPEHRNSTTDMPDNPLSPTVARRRRRRKGKPPRPLRTLHAPDSVRHRPAASLPPEGPSGTAEQRHALA